MLTWYIGLINEWFAHNPVGLAVVFLFSVVSLRLLPWLYKYLSGRRKTEIENITHYHEQVEEIYNNVEEHHNNNRIHYDVGDLVTSKQMEKFEEKYDVNTQRVFDKIDKLSEKVSRTEGRLNGPGA